MHKEDVKVDITNDLKTHLDINLKEGEKIKLLGVPGDGSCLIHSLNSATKQSKYLDKSRDEKQVLAIKMRRKIGNNLINHIHSGHYINEYLKYIEHDKYIYTRIYNVYANNSELTNFNELFKKIKLDQNEKAIVKSTFIEFFKKERNKIKNINEWLGHEELLNIREIYRHNIIVIKKIKNKNDSRYESYNLYPHDQQYKEYIVVLWVGGAHFESIYIHDTNENRNIRRFPEDHPFIQQLLSK